MSTNRLASAADSALNTDYYLSYLLAPPSLLGKATKGEWSFAIEQAHSNNARQVNYV